MAENRFTQLNFCACLTLAILLGLLIAAATVDWYRYSLEFDGSLGDGSTGIDKTQINSTKQFWALNGLTTETETWDNGATNSRFTDYDDNDGQAAIFALAQAFTLIALIVAGLLLLVFTLLFAAPIRNKLLFIAGMTVLRVVLFALVLIVVISVVTAFLGFLGLTDAFSDDIPSCQLGYCRRFQDEVNNEYGQQTLTRSGTSITVVVTSTEAWGPSAGWFIVLACIPLSILVLLIVVVNKFPIPVDSVGIGEAL